MVSFHIQDHIEIFYIIEDSMPYLVQVYTLQPHLQAIQVVKRYKES